MESMHPSKPFFFLKNWHMRNLLLMRRKISGWFGRNYAICRIWLNTDWNLCHTPPRKHTAHQYSKCRASHSWW
jgi:hypothetical protein